MTVFAAAQQVVNHSAGPSLGVGKESGSNFHQERVSKCLPETSGSKKYGHVFSSTVDWERVKSKGT